MTHDIRVKICGLREAAHIRAAVAAGAGYVGFMFFDRSPRTIAPADAARLAAEMPPGVAKVGVTVDMDDAALDALLGAVPLDLLQLHGAESPERVAEVRSRYGLPVIRAVGVADEGDLAALDTFGRVADQLLVDAKPPKGAARPGGNAVTFDWRLIAGRRWACPWMLSGGLTAENVAEAVRLTGARQVDVSSGVEIAPGVKNAGLIEAFVAAAQA
jgi:phosphoribosylanthranilate isomerase